MFFRKAAHRGVVSVGVFPSWVLGMLTGVVLIAGAATGQAQQAGISLYKNARVARSEQQILAALDRSVSVEFKNTPLNQVTAEFQRLLGVPIRLDSKGLMDNSLSEDHPITFSGSGISARAALDTILNAMDLDWMIDGEYLLVTIHEKEMTTVTTKIYPVADLILIETPNGYDVDYDTLVQVITSTIAPQSWDAAGGPGSIEPFAQSGALVISETREVHEQVESLLEQLRAVRDLQGLPITMKFGGGYGRMVGDSQDVPEPSGNQETDSPQPAAQAAPPPKWQVSRAYH